MPAISVDTFFACSLMIIAVLSAMAGASKLLYPYVNNAADLNVNERYREVSRYLLLSRGVSPNWGQNDQVIPTIFGLGKAGSDEPYELDIDKVSRLNSENQYALSYAEAFTSLGISDVSFRIGIKPAFDVAINLTAAFVQANEKVYEFEVLTEKTGTPVQATLKCYVIAENYLNASESLTSSGKIYQNITIPNSIAGPALLVAFARSVYDARMVSFSTFAFEHNSTEPQPRGTFLTLSPLNHVLNASYVYSETNMSNAYALTFDYNSTLTEVAVNNRSAAYEIPRFVDPSPIMVVLTGWNSSTFHVECVTYPQVPLQIGADFTSFTTRSDIFSYDYAVTIEAVVYECTMWLGGSRD